MKLGTLLVVTESPITRGVEKPSGFARVAQNLLRRWKPHFSRIDVWAIGFDGMPPLAESSAAEFIRPPFRLFPQDAVRWADAAGLRALAQLIYDGDYTHVWIQQDHFHFTDPHWIQMFRRACAPRAKARMEGGGSRIEGRKDDPSSILHSPSSFRPPVKSFYYVPVDGPMTAAGTALVAAVDCPVGYTDYAVQECSRHNRTLRQKPLFPHLPLGVDTQVYHPVPAAERERIRATRLLVGGRQWIFPGDLVLLNVNQNTRRKDILRSLQILRALRDLGLTRFKLVLHMTDQAVGNDNSRITSMARQLGLEQGREYVHTDAMFQNELALGSEADLNQLYSVADLYLTTTLGEGWGLSITEALATGCPVAGPDHTACREIAEMVRGVGERGWKMEDGGSKIADPSSILHPPPSPLSSGMPDRVIVLPLEKHGTVLALDGSRVRHRVDVEGAVRAIFTAYQNGWLEPERRRPLTKAIRKWLSWDRIAAQWLRLFEMEIPRPELELARRLEALRETAGIVEQVGHWNEENAKRDNEDGGLRIEDRKADPSSILHPPSSQIRAGFFELPLAPGEIHLNCAVIEVDAPFREGAERDTRGRVCSPDLVLVTRQMKDGVNGLAFWDLGEAEDRGLKIEDSKADPSSILHPRSSFRVLGKPRVTIRKDDGEYHMEDPRIIPDGAGGYWLAVHQHPGVERIRHKHQMMLRLDAEFMPVEEHHIEYAGNGKDMFSNTGHECNWTYFLHEQELKGGKVEGLKGEELKSGTVEELKSGTGEELKGGTVEELKSEESKHPPLQPLNSSTLHLLYSMQPQVIVRLECEDGGLKMEDRKANPSSILYSPSSPALVAVAEHVSDVAFPWPYGPMRGGAPPVRVGDEYFVFFHSSVEAGQSHLKRQYFMGCYAFSAVPRPGAGTLRPTFTPTRCTPEPLLMGSAEDPMLPWSPQVVFPCGAVLRKGEERGSKIEDRKADPSSILHPPPSSSSEWLVTLGVNDAACAWLTIPHERLLERMVAVGGGGGWKVEGRR